MGYPHALICFLPVTTYTLLHPSIHASLPFPRPAYPGEAKSKIINAAVIF